MKQLLSITLSLLLLLSSSGITYAQHFCGDFEMIAKVTLGEASLSCGMQMEDSACEDEEAVGHGCCDNEYTSVDTDENYAGVSFDMDLNPVFAIAFVSVFVFDSSNNYQPNLHWFKDHGPPPLGENLQVLYQRFLI